MIADPSAAERAYQQLRDDILNARLPMGPLDIRALGDRLRMSVTPVREALARLNAERLVKLAPHQGYAVAIPSARRLEHIYELAGVLIDLVLQRAGAARWAHTPASHPGRSGASYAEVMAALMKEMATAQTNVELAEHVFALNDRLGPARRCEPRIFCDAEQEAEAFGFLWLSRDLGELRRRLHRHHDTRIERVDTIARLLAEQASDP